jgi:hypothetical protein
LRSWCSNPGISASPTKWRQSWRTVPFHKPVLSQMFEFMPLFLKSALEEQSLLSSAHLHKVFSFQRGISNVCLSADPVPPVFLRCGLKFFLRRCWEHAAHLGFVEQSAEKADLVKVLFWCSFLLFWVHMIPFYSTISCPSCSSVHCVHVEPF